MPLASAWYVKLCMNGLTMADMKLWYSNYVSH